MLKTIVSLSLCFTGAGLFLYGVHEIHYSLPWICGGALLYRMGVKSL